MNAHRGFTLVEILVTASLMAVVGAATVAALSGGIRVWERAVQFGVSRQASVMVCGRFRQDLQNLRQFAPIPFTGTYEEVAFATVGQDVADRTRPPELGTLSYVLDERAHSLCRAFVPYRQLRRVRLKERCQDILDGLTRLRFAYFGVSEEGGDAGWTDRWESVEPPLAVKVEIAMAARDGQPPVQQSVVLPVMHAVSHESTAR